MFTCLMLPTLNYYKITQHYGFLAEWKVSGGGCPFQKKKKKHTEPMPIYRSHSYFVSCLC